MLLQEIALKLNVPPRQLELASLQACLERELRLVESEMFRLAHKYGIRTVQELDGMTTFPTPIGRMYPRFPTTFMMESKTCHCHSI